MSPPRNSRSPKFNSRSKFSSPHTSPSTPSPSSRHRHSQSLQSLQSIHSLQSIQSNPLTTPPRTRGKPPRPLLERLLSPLALSPMSSPLHSPLHALTFESQQSQQSQSPLPVSPHKESRSERMLREALIRDDLAFSQSSTPIAVQEPTLMLLGLPSPPLTRPTHRRRHSHIPVASRTGAADVLVKTGYGYGYGVEGSGNGNTERRSDQKRGGRASELRDRVHDRRHDGELHQQRYEHPLSSSPSSSSIASSRYPHSQHSYSLSTPHSPKHYYGGDAETMYPSPAPSFPPYSAFPRPTEPTGVRPHRGYSTPEFRRNVSTDPRRVDSSPNPRRADLARADSPSPSPHPRQASTSTSPSPYSRQQQAPSSPSPYRPKSPALYQSPTRAHSPSPSRLHQQTPTQGQAQRSRKRQSLPVSIYSSLPATPSAPNHVVHVVQTTPGIPLPMTPHEKALRARLERVLYANGGATLASPESGKGRREGLELNEGRPGKRERYGSNEVRDETGGWPWRERERDMISTPPTSASSSGSGSHSPHSPHSQPSQLSQEHHTNTQSLSSSSASIAQPQQQRQIPPSVNRNASPSVNRNNSPSVTRDASPSLQRTRGSSESQNRTPNSTPNPNVTPSRNRSTTSPFQSRIPQPAVYKSQPVTPRTPARGQMQQQQQNATRSQSKTPAPMPLHLPTTPRRATTVGTTTPRTPRTPALAPPRTPKTGVTAVATTPRTPGIAANDEIKRPDAGGNIELKTDSETESKEAHSGTESKEGRSGGVLTPPPTPPVRAHVPESSPGPFKLQTGLGVGRPSGRGQSTSVEGSEEEGGVDDVGAGTETDTDVDAGTESDATGEHGEGGPPDTPTKLRLKECRPFNARKASERLKGTEGYVSFASVEGLGEPPETPVCETEGEVRGRRGFGLGVLAGWWGSRAGGEVV